MSATPRPIRVISIPFPESHVGTLAMISHWNHASSNSIRTVYTLR